LKYPAKRSYVQDFVLVTACKVV